MPTLAQQHPRSVADLAARDVLSLAKAAQGFSEPRPVFARSHLRPVGSSRLAGARHCRTVGCPFKRQGGLGFCGVCEAVYLAALELRRQLLARRGAHLRAARPDLFTGMAPELRERLLAHVAAQGAHRGQHPAVFELAGLEDFLGELRDFGLEELT